MSYWRARAQKVIAELTRDLPDTATVAQRRKALWGKGHAAHEGTSWGRRMWGKEVRKYLASHGDSYVRGTTHQVQWPADIHFPFREGTDA